MDEDTMLLHAIILMYANLCIIAYDPFAFVLDTTLLHFLHKALFFW